MPDGWHGALWGAGAGGGSGRDAAYARAAIAIGAGIEPPAAGAEGSQCGPSHDSAIASWA